MYQDISGVYCTPSFAYSNKRVTHIRVELSPVGPIPPLSASRCSADNASSRHSSSPATNQNTKETANISSPLSNSPLSFLRRLRVQDDSKFQYTCSINLSSRVARRPLASTNHGRLSESHETSESCWRVGLVRPLIYIHTRTFQRVATLVAVTSKRFGSSTVLAGIRSESLSQHCAINRSTGVAL